MKARRRLRYYYLRFIRLRGDPHELALGMALIVIGYVFGDSLGGASLVRLFIIGALVLFIGAFIFSLRRQSASRLPEKRWRGQPMDLDEARGPGSWWDRWRSRR